MDERNRKQLDELKKWKLGKAEKWLVDHAKEAGIDIDGYEHEITDYFKNHVLNRHGDQEKEDFFGQIAVKEDDFNTIADIVKNPDRAIIGAKRNGEDVLFYVKKMEDGSSLYLENILNSKKNKSLRGKTFYRKKNDIDEGALLNIASGNGRTDISKAKIIVDPHRTGGNPGDDPVKKPVADAIPAFPVDQLSNPNIPQSAPKVKERRKNEVSEDKFKNIVSMNKRTDISKAKIVNPVGTGSNPNCMPKTSVMVANPIQPSGQLSDTNIPQKPHIVKRKE
jgi:hypothetical protein